MQIREKKIQYLSDESFFSFNKEYWNWVIFTANILFDNDKFIDYQKDLIQDFIAGLIDSFSEKVVDIDVLKNNFEMWLQNLNTKLKLFADKVHDVDFFSIKWYIQIIIDNILVTSMIWDVTVLIFRDERLYYSLHNGLNSQGKIDIFSDFIEGDVETSDMIIYAGINIWDILDNNDTKELEQVIQNEETTLLDVLNEILLTRIEDKKIGLLTQYEVYYDNGAHNKKPRINLGINRNKSSKTGIDQIKWKKKFMKNKYHITISVLWLVILFMLYHVFSQILQDTDKDTYTTASGVTVDITIEDIKKEIYKFKWMDPTSEEKWNTYNDILGKLEVLESKERWIEDVAQLKKILQTDYHKWFNVIHISDLQQLDDPTTNTKTSLMAFNDMEKDRLWSLHTITWGNSLLIAGANWALINAMNNDMRGTLVEYDENVKWCNMNLLRDGLYCYTDNGNIFSVTKENGVEPVTTESLGGFDNIADIQVYGKSNIYTLAEKSNGSWGTVVTRYRNTLWSQVQFQEWQNYSIWVSNWVDFGTGFSSFVIDSTFLIWSNWALLQFWRDDATSTILTSRTVPLVWWNTMNKYSNNTKIISTFSSKYVYLFDKTNQTFTIYESRPVKTNDAFIQQYKLYYLFRFTFDLGDIRIVDVTIPEETGNRPELYLLSTDWINKINLYDFIQSIQENNALKTINN